jgi:hypothetical protein
MNSRTKPDENVFYKCNNCDKSFQVDKATSSLMTEQGMIYFCTVDCLRHFWTEKEPKLREEMEDREC